MEVGWGRLNVKKNKGLWKPGTRNKSVNKVKLQVRHDLTGGGMAFSYTCAPREKTMEHFISQMFVF